MKETYFLIERDYLHMIRLLHAAWESKKPRQLDSIKAELYNKHSLTGVTRIVA